MILELLIPVSWIVTKFTFLGILGDNIALNGRTNLLHLYIPARNWQIYWDNIRKYHIYWDENVSHCAPQRISFCTGRYPHYYSGIFYQFLSIFSQHNSGFYTHIHMHTYTCIQLHIHKHTHTHTDITKGSIFISGLLCLKPGVSN